MDEQLSITRAAQQRAWETCARIMFQQLFSCSFDEQKRITQDALLPYLKIWNNKHPDEARDGLPRESLNVSSSDELDPADTEFLNALLEYRDGISGEGGPLDQVKHFATAIRSSVLAIQINRWIQDFPDQYRHWRAGEFLGGPTFLDDKAAADDAEKAWKNIDFLFSRGHKARARSEITMNNIEDACREWERSLL